MNYSMEGVELNPVTIVFLTRMPVAHCVTLSFFCLDTHMCLFYSENKEGISGTPEAEMEGVTAKELVQSPEPWGLGQP